MNSAQSGGSGQTTVVVPFRSIADGKSRLAPLLGPRARRQLCVFMLETTLRRLDGLGPVIVVSDDETARPIVRDAGASFVHARRPRDLNAALDQAREQVPPENAMLVVPTDLPRLDRTTLSGLCAACSELVIAPDRAGTGTNLLHLPAPSVADYGFRFGPASCAAHFAEARRLGCTPHLYHAPGTEFDLDTPEDLALALADGVLPGLSNAYTWRRPVRPDPHTPQCVDAPETGAAQDATGRRTRLRITTAIPPDGGHLQPH